MPTAAHFIYIPAVLILGIVIGGSSDRAQQRTLMQRSCGRLRPNRTRQT